MSHEKMKAFIREMESDPPQVTGNEVPTKWQPKKGVWCKYCEILVEYSDMKHWRKDNETVDFLCPGCDCVLVEGE